MWTLRLSEIARLVGGELIGGHDPELTGVAGLAEAGARDLSFLAAGKRPAAADSSNAGALIVGRKVVVDKPSVQVDDPYRAFARVLAEVQIDLDRVFPAGIHPTAIIAPDADVTQAAAIGPYCVVGSGATIGRGTRLGAQVTIGCEVVVGEDCLVYPQVVIREGCRLGRAVIVHAGVVLGSDGFGYLPGPSGMEKVPQVGIVSVADNVEIGAGATIDRATTGTTLIGSGTKIDNLVQIAHNVRLGQGCAVSAQTGIAGSCVVEDGVIFGGQAGVGDHIRIGEGAQIGGQAGVVGDLGAGSRVFGTPSQDVKDSFRTAAAARRVPALLETVRELKKRMARLEEQLAEAGDTGSPPIEDQEN